MKSNNAKKVKGEGRYKYLCGWTLTYIYGAFRIKIYYMKNIVISHFTVHKHEGRDLKWMFAIEEKA